MSFVTLLHNVKKFFSYHAKFALKYDLNDAAQSLAFSQVKNNALNVIYVHLQQGWNEFTKEI